MAGSGAMRFGRLGHVLLIALCFGAPALAYTASGVTDATNSGADNPRLAVTRHAMPPPDVTAKPAATPTVSANPLWAIPLNALAATRNRPLFTPSRRPPAPAVASVPAAAPRPQPAPPAVAPQPHLNLIGPVGREGGGGAAASELDVDRHCRQRGRRRGRVHRYDDAGRGAATHRRGPFGLGSAIGGAKGGDLAEGGSDPNPRPAPAQRG